MATCAWFADHEGNARSNLLSVITEILSDSKQVSDSQMVSHINLVTSKQLHNMQNLVVNLLPHFTRVVKSSID